MNINYDYLLKAAPTICAVYTAVMVKKTYDLLHEYTHRDYWETSYEWSVRRRKEEKFKAQQQRQKEQEEWLKRKAES